MPAEDVVIKQLPAVRVAELTAVAKDFDTIGPVIQPLYEAVPAPRRGRHPAHGGWCRPLRGRAGRRHPRPRGGRVSAAPRDGGDSGDGVRVLDLPPVESAPRPSCTGDRWTPSCPRSRRSPAGSTPTGTARSDTPGEINLECPEDRADWVTELQEPLA